MKKEPVRNGAEQDHVYHRRAYVGLCRVGRWIKRSMSKRARRRGTEEANKQYAEFSHATRRGGA